MLVILYLLLIIFVPVMVLKLTTYSFSTPHPFGCGTDEVCYCEEAPDCKKREGEEE
jgi:hypothetical protein